ncbi:MAG: hypothetical protein IJM62_05475, partial [Lachnospiraceae bacterium]|nr:hypothetical protein [Lachnospiraceae bacterium]
HILKPRFWYSSAEMDEFQGNNAYTWSNFDFIARIRSGIKAREGNGNVFQFLWIQGPHNPVVMDRYAEPVEQRIYSLEDDRFSEAQSEQAIGTVRMFTELIKELKNKGIYDNTTIIITADHGWDTRPNPLLMIKPAGSSGPLKTSYAPVSMLEDYEGTFLYFVTGEDNGKTIFDIDEDTERLRPIYVYDIVKATREYTGMKTEYYKEGAFTLTYKLGEELLPDDIASHAVKGIAVSEGKHVWTRAGTSVLEFDISDAGGGELTFEIKYGIYHDKQRYTVYANDVKVFEHTAKKPEKQQIAIPEGVVKDDGKLVIRFELPDCVSPHELGKGDDKRELALSITSITISKQDE